MNDNFWCSSPLAEWSCWQSTVMLTWFFDWKLIKWMSDWECTRNDQIKGDVRGIHTKTQDKAQRGWWRCEDMKLHQRRIQGTHRIKRHTLRNNTARRLDTILARHTSPLAALDQQILEVSVLHNDSPHYNLLLARYQRQLYEFFGKPLMNLCWKMSIWQPSQKRMALSYSKTKQALL